MFNVQVRRATPLCLFKQDFLTRFTYLAIGVDGANLRNRRGNKTPFSSLQERKGQTAINEKLMWPSSYCFQSAEAKSFQAVSPLI